MGDSVNLRHVVLVFWNPNDLKSLMSTGSSKSGDVHLYATSENMSPDMKDLDLNDMFCLAKDVEIKVLKNQIREK